jgi:hypothetical protein
MKVYFGFDKPDPIKYMPRPKNESNLVDVWLRKNIEQVEVEDIEYDEEGKEKKRTYLQWQADEEYMLTDATYEDIEANFDDYYYKAGPQPTVEERLDIVEGVIGEMMEG